MPSAETSIAAAAVSLANAVFLALYTNMSHLRAIRPSTLIIFFLSFTAIFDTISCRTLWLVDELSPLAWAFTASVVLKLILFGVEAKSKRYQLIEDWRFYGAEDTSSAVGFLLMWWLNKLFRDGWNRFLTTDDLPRLKPIFRAESVLPKFLQSWARFKDSGKYAIVLVILNSCRTAVLFPIIPRLILAVYKLSIPMYISQMIKHIERQENASDRDTATSYALMIGGILIFVGRPLLDSAYDQAQGQMRIMIRTSLMSSILHYGTEMEPGEKKGSAALTLITVDVGRVVGSFYFLHEFWIGPLEVILAIALLADQVGWGFIGPIVTIIIGAGISAFISMYVPAAQRKLNEAIEKRVSDTTTVIGHMKETKMLGLVDDWFVAIKKLLDTQIRQSLAYRKFFVLLNIASKMPESLAPCISFGIAIMMSKTGERLTISDAFTSMNLLFLIVNPIAMISHMYPFIVGALPCFVRIQEFLKLCSAYEERVALLGASGELAPSEEALLPGFEEPIFAIDKANVTSKTADEPLIKDATVKILPRTFNVVAGKVGTGKSVLLQALLGQLPISGDAKVRTSNVAYCAQTPWITSGTAKDNIVAKSEPDEPWYKTVVTACGLDRDFQDFAKGDATTVGTKGVSLSGGQKQRISLARGLFSRKPIIFVDDILSGLDWATQRFVWDEVFGPSGLLRKNGITVVVATHALHLIDQPDSVILLGDDGPGSLIQGTLDELKTKTKIQDLIATSHSADDEAGAATPSSASSQKGVAAASAAAATEGMGDEERQRDVLRKTGDWGLYSYYLNMVGANGVLWFALVVVAAAVWPVLPTLWLKWWTETNATAEHVNTAFFYFGFMLLSFGDMASIGLAMYYSLLVIAPTALRKMHNRLLKTTMAAPLSFFVATPPGDLVNRFSRDVEQVDLELPMNMVFAFMSLVWLVALFGVVMLGSIYMSIFVVPMLVFVFFLQKWYLRTSRQIRHLDIQSSAPMNTHMIEMIDGAATVQAYGWQSKYQAHGMDLLNTTMKPNYMLRVIQMWLDMVLNLFVSGIVITLIVLCISLPSSTSAGGIAVAMTNVMGLGGSLTWFVTTYTQMETALGSIDRLRTFEANTPKEAAPAHPQDLPMVWPRQGAIKFSSVTASYPPKGSSPAFRALNEIDIDIQPGKKVAICGRTGSGKSSLLLTLFRLLDLESGSIEIDGIDIANVEQNVLRPRLIVVPQEPMLLPGTLRSNLVRNLTEDGEEDEIDEEKLVNHLKTVELWDVVEPQGGLNTNTADLKLSHGQKQLICLARALARREESPIVVLDEAMSTVDKQTEELMVKILEEQFKEHTVISVVHRLNTVEKFDTVLLLDSGAVAEMGTPEELLAKEGGRFRALWHGKEAS